MESAGEATLFTRHRWSVWALGKCFCGISLLSFTQGIQHWVLYLEESFVLTNRYTCISVCKMYELVRTIH